MIKLWSFRRTDPVYRFSWAFVGCAELVEISIVYCLRWETCADCDTDGAFFSSLGLMMGAGIG